MKSDEDPEIVKMLEELAEQMAEEFLLEQRSEQVAKVLMERHRELPPPTPRPSAGMLIWS